MNVRITGLKSLLQLHLKNFTDTAIYSNLCIDVLEKAAAQNPKKFGTKAKELTAYFEKKLKEHTAYILKYGKDMPEIDEWHFTRPFEPVEMPEGMVCAPHLDKNDIAKHQHKK